MEERDYVIPEDVKRVFTDVTAHRMILDSRARYQEQSAKDILEEILKDTPATEGRGIMKNRILLLIWFILLALAAVFTGAVYAVLLLLSALAVVAFLLLGFFCGKKDHHES